MHLDNKDGDEKNINSSDEQSNLSLFMSASGGGQII